MLNSLKEFYQQILMHQDPVINSAINLLIILLTGIITWWVFNFVLGRFEKTYKEKPFFERNQRFFMLLKKAGHYSIIILMCIGLINLIHIPLLGKVLYAVMILLLASFANAISIDLLPYIEHKLTSRTDTKLDDVIFDLLNRFATVIIFATAIVLALDVLGVNIMPFIAGAGVAGIAIGFAAKDTLSNIIAGVLLIIDRPFEVGDRIEVWSAPVNSATWGDVLNIGLMATKIRTTDNIIIVIPNNEIMKRDIINYTTVTDEIRVRILIGIAYDADVKKAKEIIVKSSLELDWVMNDPAPTVVVKSFGESAVNLEARVWISEPRKRMDTISHITDRVKESFQEEGIEIPFPKRDIYVRSGRIE